MIGLITKDFLVFKLRFHWVYRLVGTILLAGIVIVFPHQVHYIAIMLPLLGVAFLTEIIKVEEKSDWKDYLPVLPITSHEIVLSRYVFCGVLLAAFAVLSLALCAIAAALGKFALGTILTDYILGIWFAVLMVCFGIPGGYYFKNELCTGAMINSCVLIGAIHCTGADTFFFRIGSPVAYLILLIVTAMIVFLSYRIALWIYSSKKDKKTKPSMANG